MAFRRVRTSMAFELCLLMASLTLTSAQLNLYIAKSDVNTKLKMNFNFDLYLIKENKPAQLLQDPRAFYEFMSPLRSSVKGIKMCWFSSPKKSSYSLKLLSSDTEMMPHPVASIANDGVVSHSFFTFYISLACTGKKAGLVDVSMMLNYTSIVSGSVQRSTLKKFYIKVKKWCEKTVKDPDKKVDDKSEWSRGAIVGLSAGITVFLCLSVGLGLLCKHYLRQRRLKMEFEDDLEIEEKREFGLKKVRHLPVHRSPPSTSPPVLYSPKRPKFGVVRPRKRSETKTSDISTVGLICKDDSDEEDSSQQSRQMNHNSTRINENMATENQGFSSCASESWSKAFADKLIDPALLQIKELIGTGVWCEVYYGLLKSEKNTEDIMEVAVKTLKDGVPHEASNTFMKKIMATKNLSHPNLLAPLGIVLRPSSTPQVVMPYMKYKELNKFLRQEQDLSSQEIFYIGSQIAKAMDYLVENNCCHNNLTSAHCMVGEGNMVKVAYDSLNTQKQNMKWMAPESLKDGVFSQKSDVWSFGILLWEMTSSGQLPYQDISSQGLLDHLLSGNRLSQPLNCPDELYAVMMHCWSLNPEDRPTFRWLVELLCKLKVDLETKQMSETVC